MIAGSGVSSIPAGESGLSAVDLLALVKNPEIYDAKMKALADAQGELTRRIELVGAVDEILALRDKARDDAKAAAEDRVTASDELARAVRVRTDAETASAAALAAATATADQTISDASNRAAAVETAAADKLSQARELQEAVDRRAGQLDEQEDRLDEEKKAADAAFLAVKKLQEKVASKLNRIAEIAAEE